LAIASFLFCRVPMHPARAEKFASTGFVAFRRQDLPACHCGDELLERIDGFNSNVRSLFLQHLRAYVHSTPAVQDSVAHFQLPLSKSPFAHGSGAGAASSSGGGAASSGAGVGAVLPLLQRCSQRLSLRSPFMGVRGLPDDFATVHELARDVRSDVFVSTSQVCAWVCLGVSVNLHIGVVLPVVSCVMTSVRVTVPSSLTYSHRRLVWLAGARVRRDEPAREQVHPGLLQQGHSTHRGGGRAPRASEGREGAAAARRLWREEGGGVSGGGCSGGGGV
jgi:uncharacterized membrane protein YgcG